MTANVSALDMLYVDTIRFCRLGPDLPDTDGATQTVSQYNLDCFGTCWLCSYACHHLPFRFFLSCTSYPR